ncbi:MAG: hypothetical protein V1872_13215, partial [bacterium]
IYERRMGILSLNSLFWHPADLAWFIFNASAILFVIDSKGLAGVSAFIGSLALRIKDILAWIFVVPIYNKKIIKYIPILLLIVFVFVCIYKRVYPKHYLQYFGDLYSMKTARNALYWTGLSIMKENFPLGEGFGRFGGFISYKYYSPVFEKYGIHSVYGLSTKKGNFISDTFWPMIIGEGGLLGLFFYILLIYNIFSFLFKKNDDFFSEKLLLIGRNMFIMSIIISIAAPVFVRPPQYFILFGFTGLIYSYIKEIHY